MVKNEAISALSNTIKQLHIHKNMHMAYKQDFYKTKETEIDDLFHGYLVPVMEDLEHPTLIEEWIHILDAAAYEKNLHKDEKLPSMKKKVYCNYKIECCTKSIMESLNSLQFLDIIYFNADRIKNDKNLLPSLLKVLQCLRLNVVGIKKKKVIKKL